MKTRSHRGVGALVLVMAILFVLAIWATASWSMSRNLMFEVAMAEAGRTLKVSCESAAEEAMEGIVRSANLAGLTRLTDESEREAREFAKAFRELEMGQVLTARFVPKNSRKAAAELGVALEDIELTAFLDREVPGEGIDRSGCKKLRAVMEKWAKIGG